MQIGNSKKVEIAIKEGHHIVINQYKRRILHLLAYTYPTCAHVHVW